MRALQKVFSVGLDLKTLVGISSASFREFWISFEDMIVSLYTSRLATVAAVSAHATALLARSVPSLRISQSPNLHRPPPPHTTTTTTTTAHTQVGFLFSDGFGPLETVIRVKTCFDVVLQYV